MAEYKLSASLAEHEDDVRAVTFPDPKTVISASRDGTVRYWKLLSDNFPTFDAIISFHSRAFVNAVTYLPPNREYTEGLIISGGKDTVIDVRPPFKAPDENAEALLLGHSHNICALDVDPEGKYIVSGSWDEEARIWPLGKWECAAVLKGHVGSVLGVLAFDSDTIITGCADKMIRVFDMRGKLLRTIKGSEDVVRAFCRVSKGHPSGADFASAGNDGVIRLWTLAGRQVARLQGHENFIYSLASTPSGELISSGEDRSLRVWKGYECVQTIIHPAISIWDVAVCAENGDIVSGASDRIVRVFTRSPERYANDETIQQFQTSVKESSIPQQALSETINREKLPGPEFLQQKSGTKEGQTQMINEPNGSITAHTWSGGQWVKVGTVVDAVGSSGKKEDYLGESYDYVFNVDIKDGEPPLKLPYNLSQNPFEAATKFIHDNGLPITYLDQVANFITTNIQGATIGQASQPSGPDAWGSENRYRPGDGTAADSATSNPTAKLLPQKTYLSILVSSLPKIVSKIEELNTSFLSSGRQDISLNPTELTILTDLRKYLETSTSSSTTKSSPAVKSGLHLAIKLSTKWPYTNRLPGLDLLRLLAPSPKTAQYINETSSGISQTILDILTTAVLDPKEKSAKNHLMMAIRFFSNLFLSPAGRQLALKEFPKIQEFITSSLQGVGKGDRNTAVAATTVWINYAVLISSSEEVKTAGIGEDVVFEHALAVLEGSKNVLEEEETADGEAVYRALVAVGTMLFVGTEVKSAAREVLSLGETVRKVEKGKLGEKEKRVRDLAGEVGGLIAEFEMS